MPVTINLDGASYPGKPLYILGISNSAGLSFYYGRTETALYTEVATEYCADYWNEVAGNWCSDGTQLPETYDEALAMWPNPYDLVWKYFDAHDQELAESDVFYL